MKLAHEKDSINYIDVDGIIDSFVADMYIKKEYNAEKDNSYMDILVIEANFSDRDMDYKSYAERLSELLMVLPEIKDQVEFCTGQIDRVDIRTH